MSITKKRKKSYGLMYCFVMGRQMISINKVKLRLKTTKMEIKQKLRGKKRKNSLDIPQCIYISNIKKTLPKTCSIFLARYR